MPVSSLYLREKCDYSEPKFLASLARHYKIRIWLGTTEKVGAKGEVTSSNQDSKNKVATSVCSKWVFGKVFAVFFFFECYRNSN